MEPTTHTRHRQHNHRHQTRNAKATNRQGGVAAHVTTARVRAAVAPVLSLSALPPPGIYRWLCVQRLLVLRSKLPWAAGCTSAASGLPEAFLESAAGFSRWLLLSLMFMRMHACSIDSIRLCWLAAKFSARLPPAACSIAIDQKVVTESYKI